MTQPSEKSSWLGRLTQGLKKTSQKLGDAMASMRGSRPLDGEMLQTLEDTLISADMGVKISIRFIDQLKERRYGQEISLLEIKEFLADSVMKVLEPVAIPLEINLQHKPHVILMAGMNGSGKTTTLGKLASQWHKAGFQLSMGAGDTFRAAAIEQLQVWGERAGVPVFIPTQGSDAAGLAYEAYEKARGRKDSILLIDTAGRLHSNGNLMAELTKINRVLGKIDSSAPHTRLLIIDGTIGQNAMAQVENFKKAIDVNGLIITKLDGTAKGGVVVQIAETFGIPIHGIGVGEGIEDLQPFKAHAFSRALLGISSE